MRETRDVDLDYHVRHSALPHPGGQRELGILVSRLHSNQLDLHRPLWEVHLIEGLEGNRFAMYSKIHHSLVDGVSGMRLIMRALSTDPDKRGMASFWTVGAGEKPRHDVEQSGPLGALGRPLGALRGAARPPAACRARRSTWPSPRSTTALCRRPIARPAPCSAVGSAGSGALPPSSTSWLASSAWRAPPTVRLNDIVLYLCGSALRRYLAEHARVPDRPLVAGIPVNLREADDQSMGTAIGIMLAELGTNVADPMQRLRAIARSTAEAKHHLGELPPEARTSYTLLINAPYIAALVAGLGGRAPIPFNLGISNVPGPSEPLYLNGSRLDSLSPLSLLMHGNALNITCVSYAGTLNFGLTGARDTLPHLQRLAIYMGDALDEIERPLLGKNTAKPVSKKQPPATASRRPSASRPAPNARARAPLPSGAGISRAEAPARPRRAPARVRPRQVTPQEVQLIDHGLLERRARVDVEVADRIRTHLGTAGGAPSSVLRGLRRCNGVSVGDLHEHRARQAVGLQARAIETQPQRDARGDLVAPGRTGDRAHAGSESGVVMKARPPGAPTAGAITGARPRSEPSRSRTAAVSFACPPGRSCAGR